MSLTYQEVSSCHPSDKDDVYIFSILPVINRGIAAITSADELLLLDSNTLQQSTRLGPVPKNLTSLTVLDDGFTAVCGGADGVVALFDVRSQSQVAQFRIGTFELGHYARSDHGLQIDHKPSGKPVNVLTCKRNDLGIGSESVVSVW